jgi:hypothetical protein
MIATISFKIPKQGIQKIDGHTFLKLFLIQ